MVIIGGLVFGYGREPLFRGLDLSILAGNIYGLLGRNGAGKTTLLKIVSGLIFPFEGACKVLGMQPRERLPSFLSEIYFLPEEFYLPPHTPPRYADLYAPFYPRFSHEDFSRYLMEFELDREKKVTSYSYGQKKKFLLAFALATGCRLLLLDEPTNGLDIPSKSQFRRLVTSALTEERTFLISTHQVRDMENLIDPVIILEDGRIIFNQSLEEVGRRFSARLQAKEPQPGSALYVEKVLGGYTVVEEHEGPGADSAIDLETLFNMVVANKARSGELFGVHAGGIA